MREIKELNIKNNTYYFYDDMVDIKKFQSNLIKIDKKSYKDIDIYYIGYVTIKKFDEFSDYENIHSVNSLYLLFHSVTGYFEEKMVRNICFLILQINMKKFFLELNHK